MFERLYALLDKGRAKLRRALTRMLWRRRVVVLPPMLTTNACLYLMGEVRRLDMESREPIAVICDSGGGKLDVAVALAVTIGQCKAPVVGIVYREAASAAVIIFASCRWRVMASRAVLKTHKSYMYGMADQGLAPAALEEKLKYFENWKRELLHTYAGRVLPDELFGSQLRPISARESKGFGLADDSFWLLPYGAWRKAETITKR